MYKAELWTTVGQIKDGQHVTHEHWATLNERGEVVAAGGKKFCEDYAKKLNEGSGKRG
jgi:hypothetical protein